ncbi:MAG: DUF3291 domain-containing protein [Pseudomonadota bacterium]
MPDWELAQVNIGKLLKPEGDPSIQEFFDNLDRINSLAERSDGFVWRLKDDDGENATGIAVSPDPALIINMSVWRDADALFDFTYKSAHTPVMAKRRNWFTRFQGAYQALWWIPQGHRPSISEALSKLWLIDHFGPSPQAFTFKVRFPEPGIDAPPVDHEPDPWCVGSA